MNDENKVKEGAILDLEPMKAYTEAGVVGESKCQLDNEFGALVGFKNVIIIYIVIAIIGLWVYTLF